MKLEIYNEEKAPQEPVVRLRLVRQRQHYADGVTVVAVDERGERVGCGSLVSFMANGTLFRHPGVSPNLGLPLDEDGQVAIWS